MAAVLTVAGSCSRLVPFVVFSPLHLSQTRLLSQLGPENGFDRIILNLSKGAALANSEHSNTVFVAPSCKEDGPCSAHEFYSFNSSTSWAWKFEYSERVKSRMYGLEKVLGVSYEGFEHEVLELFSTIESGQKGYKVTSGFC